MRSTEPELSSANERESPAHVVDLWKPAARTDSYALWLPVTGPREGEESPPRSYGCRNIFGMARGGRKLTVGPIVHDRYHRRVAIKRVRTSRATGLAPAAALFRSLADPNRLAIAQRLARGEARVVDLTGDLGLAQSTVSAHLACLRDCGLVTSRAAGRQSFYALARPELIELLTAAEHLLAATGEAVALCPVYGGPGMRAR